MSDITEHEEDQTSAMPWLPEEFEYPPRLELLSGHHLRPIREADIDMDYPAVMGSRDRLWSIYGEAWGWPPPTLTRDEDRAELAWHADEMGKRLSFNYAIFDVDESELLGCVYIDPPEHDDEADAVVSWWVVDRAVASPVDVALDEAIPEWLAGQWPFDQVRFAVRS